MDRAILMQINRNGLVRELKKRGLQSKGKKQELVNRLEYHFLNDDSNGDDEEENALTQAERLQKEIDDRKSELAKLRSGFHNNRTNDISTHVPIATVTQPTSTHTTTTVLNTNT